MKKILGSLIIFLGLISYAAGIKVAPGAFCVQNVSIGKDLDLGLDLVVTNNSAQEQVFSVNPIKPSQAKREWIKGYGEIPEAGWFYFEKNKIKVGPHGEGKLRMRLKVPGEERYFNQHWMVYVDISSEIKKGEMLGVSIKPNYMIETVSKENIKSKPYGELGLVPSVVNVSAKEAKGKIKIFNNDKLKHVYKIYSHIPDARIKQDINQSPGYEWVGQRGWVRPEINQITLKPGEEKELVIGIHIPEKQGSDARKWESILMVEPDKGLSGFVRILIKT